MDEMDVFLHAEDPAAGDIPALQAQLQESQVSALQEQLQESQLVLYRHNYRKVS